MIPQVKFFALVAVAALVGGCSVEEPSVGSAPEELPSSSSNDFDLRILDSLGKPLELTRFQRQPTGLFTPSGFEIKFYEPTLEGASDECQAIVDAQELAIYGGGESERVRNAVHPSFRGFSDIYGYKYVLENYPDWDPERDGLLPEDFADLQVHLALVTYPTSDGPKEFVETLSNYAEVCDLAQSDGKRVTLDPDDREFLFVKVYNYLGLETRDSGSSGDFYFTWQESSRATSSEFPSRSPEEVYFGVDTLLGTYSGNLLFLAYYDFWEKDSTNLGITTTEIDAAIRSTLAELNELLY